MISAFAQFYVMAYPRVESPGVSYFLFFIITGTVVCAACHILLCELAFTS